MEQLRKAVTGIHGLLRESPAAALEQKWFWKVRREPFCCLLPANIDLVEEKFGLNHKAECLAGNESLQLRQVFRHIVTAAPLVSSPNWVGSDVREIALHCQSCGQMSGDLLTTIWPEDITHPVRRDSSRIEQLERQLKRVKLEDFVDTQVMLAKRSWMEAQKGSNV